MLPLSKKKGQNQGIWSEVELKMEEQAGDVLCYPDLTLGDCPPQSPDSPPLEAASPWCRRGGGLAGLKVREPSAMAGDEPQSFVGSSGWYAALSREDVFLSF